jgi:hypothetical protein
MIFDIEPMIFPPGNVEGNLYDRYLSSACCLNWMPAPPTTDGFLEVG